MCVESLQDESGESSKVMRDEAEALFGVAGVVAEVQRRGASPRGHRRGALGRGWRAVSMDSAL